MGTVKMSAGTDMLMKSLFGLLGVTPEDMKAKAADFESIARKFAADIDAIKNGIEEIQKQNTAIMIALDLRGATPALPDNGESNGEKES